MQKGQCGVGMVPRLGEGDRAGSGAFAVYPNPS